MDIVNLVLGVCTLLSVGFGLYRYFGEQHRSQVERAKVTALTERLEHAKYSLAIIQETVDLTIQRLKADPQRDVTDLLRVARGSLSVAIRELEADRLRLKNWQFGR